MDYIAIIVSLVAVVGAGFAFLRANSSHHILGKRIETLKEKNNLMEARLRKLEGNAGRGNRPANEASESGRRNQPRQEQQNEPNPRNQQRQEQQNESRQNEPRQKQPRQEQQERRQKQRERQPQPLQQDATAASLSLPDEEAAQQPQQPRRKKENRRRNEPRERASYGELERGEEQTPAQRPVKLEIAGGDLLDELEQQSGNASPITAPEEATYSGKKYAIIPEDGVIRLHQLQQQPDSDSYIEVDAPADGGNSTHYRFNLAGNHAFVIAQGIDRLENAFDFEKPSNRVVNKVVQQQDGLLTKVNNGWKIVEKARIDFR
ncbi:hypothetical protein [Pontibacter russatus]|uniref:hypothetical protein n=1 Tax=Pontibacter russatus TaxID=2694929 RepID=UPI00137AB0EC|nr:hypothetical protein [Pontibacter russatus]